MERRLPGRSRSSRPSATGADRPSAGTIGRRSRARRTGQTVPHGPAPPAYLRDGDPARLVLGGGARARLRPGHRGAARRHPGEGTGSAAADPAARRPHRGGRAAPGTRRTAAAAPRRGPRRTRAPRRPRRRTGRRRDPLAVGPRLLAALPGTTVRVTLCVRSRDAVPAALADGTARLGLVDGLTTAGTPLPPPLPDGAAPAPSGPSRRPPSASPRPPSPSTCPPATRWPAAAA